MNKANFSIDQNNTDDIQVEYSSYVSNVLWAESHDEKNEFLQEYKKNNIPQLIEVYQETCQNIMNTNEKINIDPTVVKDFFKTFKISDIERIFFTTEHKGQDIYNILEEKSIQRLKDYIQKNLKKDDAYKTKDKYDIKYFYNMYKEELAANKIDKISSKKFNDEVYNYFLDKHIQIAKDNLTLYTGELLKKHKCDIDHIAITEYENFNDDGWVALICIFIWMTYRKRSQDTLQKSYPEYRRMYCIEEYFPREVKSKKTSYHTKNTITTKQQRKQITITEEETQKKPLPADLMEVIKKIENKIPQDIIDIHANIKSAYYQNKPVDLTALTHHFDVISQETIEQIIAILEEKWLSAITQEIETQKKETSKQITNNFKKSSTYTKPKKNKDHQKKTSTKKIVDTILNPKFDVEKLICICKEKWYIFANEKEFRKQAADSIEANTQYTKIFVEKIIKALFDENKREKKWNGYRTIRLNNNYRLIEKNTEILDILKHDEYNEKYIIDFNRK